MPYATANSAAGAGATTDSKWVVTSGQRGHTHDVHALAIIPRTVTTTLPAAATTNSAKDAKSSSVDAAPPTTTTTVAHHLLVSGGVDTQLCVYHLQSFSHKPHKILPFPHRSPISISKPTRSFLMHQHRSLQVSHLFCFLVLSVLRCALWGCGSADEPLNYHLSPEKSVTNEYALSEAPLPHLSSLCPLFIVGWCMA